MATEQELIAQAEQTQLGLLRQALDYSKNVLSQREAALAQIEAEQSSLPTRSQINDLRARASAATDPNVAAQLTAQANALQQQRDDWSVAQSQALSQVEQSRNAVLDNERTLSEKEAQARAEPNAGNLGPPTSIEDTVAQETEDNTVIDDDPPFATNTTLPIADIDTTETGATLKTPPTTNQVDEFGGYDEAVAQQKQIAINTSGIPVQAEDGSVSQGIAINPETGETYYTSDFSGPKGITASKTDAQSSSVNQEQNQFTAQEDWRVRLSLSPAANYLYLADNPGILEPLRDTKGVVFPYTPNIQVGYSANYDATDLIHSNYKVYQYKNSSVDNIAISCDFTAQDTFEAKYLLAVIHFFRSVTKMFYGRDQSPKLGTPPPVCFLSGLGTFQFNEHPLAITSFTYQLPTDVDYIRAGVPPSLAGVNLQQNNTNTGPSRRTGLGSGGNPPGPVWSTIPPSRDYTYVPTKMQIQIGAVPMLSRNSISNNFSLEDYASGKLLRGIQNVRGGFW